MWVGGFDLREFAPQSKLRGDSPPSGPGGSLHRVLQNLEHDQRADHLALVLAPQNVRNASESWRASPSLKHLSVASEWVPQNALGAQETTKCVPQPEGRFRA